MKRNRLIATAAILLAILVFLFVFDGAPAGPAPMPQILEYSGDLYTVINANEPNFTQEDLESDPFEYYSELDALRRCGYAMACLSKELMPTQERSAIGHIKPSGWQTVKYEFVDGKYLYNRCHLIGFQLAGENDNEKNLITGTRTFNVSGMLPFENMVADYIKETGNRVLYRVTPVYDGNDLVAKGVTMEAKSVEDNGEGICFHVYVFNAEPGVEINYATGDSHARKVTGADDQADFVLNTSSKRIHKPDCKDAQTMKAENREEVTISRKLLIEQGYRPCGSCNP